MNAHQQWRANVDWQSFFVARLLRNAVEDACEQLPQELYLAASRDLDRLVNPWLIDIYDR